MNMHPNHQDQVIRLNRVEGQIKGIKKMVEDRRYCIDILSQIKAVTSALRQVELSILETHIRGCVRDAMESQERDTIEAKLEEIMKLVAKVP